MKYIRDFETIESIRTVLGEDWPYWDSHGVVFSNAILDLRERVLAALEANHGVLDDEVDDEEDDMLDIPEEEVVASRQCENGHHLNTEHNQPRLIIRIPPRAPINASQNVPDEYGMNTTFLLQSVVTLMYDIFLETNGWSLPSDSRQLTLMAI